MSDRHPWLETLFRPLVIGVMFGCIALSLVEFVRLFFSAWNGTYLVLVCVLAALEANYSYRLVRARKLRGTDLLRFRLIEVGVLFLLVKIGSYVGESWTGVLASIQSWPSSWRSSPGTFPPRPPATSSASTNRPHTTDITSPLWTAWQGVSSGAGRYC
jgi:hypothetical protein